MSVEKITTIAMSIYSYKGAYALLYGASISCCGGIKTCWHIEENLIQKIATTKGVIDSEDWHGWYKSLSFS